MNDARASGKVVCSIVASLAFALLFQAAALAEPWPAWEASAVDPAIGVTSTYDQATGHYRYTVAIGEQVLNRDKTYVPGALNYWHEFRAFVVYPTNIGSYQPPSDSSSYAKDGSSYLPNTPGWTGTNGGFQLKSENGAGVEVPAVPEDPDPSACFGWRGGGKNEGWVPIALLPKINGKYVAEFNANLPSEASGWTQTHFSLHVRDGGTWWAANSRGNPSPPPPMVPEPGTIALLAAGILAALPLLRRRGTT